jgi:thymidylate synthase
VTTKKVFTKGIIHELLWFIRGDTNIAYLNDNGVHIWDQWADEDGDLGPVYGAQWRTWHGGAGNNVIIVDQLQEVINTIKNNPNSRRIIMTAWNPSEIDAMALPPCHCLVQFYVRQGKLSCHLYQRSADVFLGVPFNIASYAILTHLIADLCGLQVGAFVHTFGDLHLYKNHINQAKKQLLRMPTDDPYIKIAAGRYKIEDYVYSDIKIRNYHPHPAIKADISV